MKKKNIKVLSSKFFIKTFQLPKLRDQDVHNKQTFQFIIYV